MPRYEAGRIHRARWPRTCGTRLRSLVQAADAADCGRGLHCRCGRCQYDHLQPGQRADVRDAVRRAPASARAHPDGRRQPRLASAMAATRGERCAGRLDRLQHRGQRQLAGTGAEHQPEPNGRCRQFLRCHRPADEPRAGLHGGGSAGRARSRGGRGQLRILAAPPGRRSRRSWQDAHVQRPAIHRRRSPCRRRAVDGRVRAGAGGLSADWSGGDA